MVHEKRSLLVDKLAGGIDCMLQSRSSCTVSITPSSVVYTGLLFKTLKCMDAALQREGGQTSQLFLLYSMRSRSSFII